MKIILFKICRFLIKILVPITSIFSKKNVNVKKAETEISKIYKEKEELFSKEDIVNNKVDENIDLSIVIPVYNAEKYIRNCLDSLLNQKTNYNYEVILVNDGSKDNSLEILKKYSNKNKIFKIVDQENKGISGARNSGLNVAKGKYVGFIDNDDYVSKDYIQKLLDRAFKNDADIVKCNFTNFYGGTGQILGTVRHDDVSINGYMGEKILEYNGYIWSGVIKRKLWNDFRFPVGFWYEDSITRLIIMRKCKKFEYIDEALYFYNIHTTNASKIIWNKGSVKSLDQYFLIKRLVQYGENMGLASDLTLYRILLWEYTTVLYQRTRHLDKATKKNVFYLASNFIKKYNYELEEKDFSTKYMDKAVKTNNYAQYKFISLYNLFGTKIRNLKRI